MALQNCGLITWPTMPGYISGGINLSNTTLDAANEAWGGVFRAPKSGTIAKPSAVPVPVHRSYLAPTLPQSTLVLSAVQTRGGWRPMEPIARARYGPSGLGKLVIAAYLFAALAVLGTGGELAASGEPQPLIVILLLIGAWVFFGRAFVVSLELSDEGLLARTLGGRRRIPWGNVKGVVAWTPEIIRLPAGLYTFHTKPLGLPLPYDYIHGIPFGDGATFTIGHGGLPDGRLALAAPLLDGGVEAVETICRRIGAPGPDPGASPLVERLARSQSLLTRWRMAAAVYCAMGSIEPLAAVVCGFPSGPFTGSVPLLLVVVGFSGACLCAGALLFGYASLARRYREAAGLTEGNTGE